MSLWQALFPGNPIGGVEGSLPFRFENFGTFAGPQASSTNYNYDKISQELLWPFDSKKVITFLDRYVKKIK